MGGILAVRAGGEVARGAVDTRRGGERAAVLVADATDHRVRGATGEFSRAEQRRRRLIDGARHCLAHRGLAATTVDDIARAGGCSRATVYRVFPGGRDEVLAGVVASETSSLLDTVRAVVAGATTLDAVVVAGMLGAGRWLAGHRVLGTLLATEPEAVLPWLAFDRQDRLLVAAGQWAAPLLSRWLDHARAVRLGEHVARIVLVYGIGGSARTTVADEAWVRHLVATYVLPGLDVDGAPHAAAASCGQALSSLEVLAHGAGSSCAAVASEHGAAEHGAAEHGAAEHGAAEHGDGSGVEQGASAPGGARRGTTSVGVGVGEHACATGVDDKGARL